MITLHVVSIFLELIIAAIGVMLVIFKKKSYGYGIALTFGIYVFYDISKFTSLNISDFLLYKIFFLATLSMLFAVLGIYKRG